MSILIRGMEMPRRGMVVNIYGDGRVTNHFDEFGKTIGKAVPVPEPHGRLGDLDELHNHLNEWYLTHEHGFSETEKIYIRAMLSGVKDSPTIIEAEEAE